MYLSVRETARLLGVSEKTIYRWIRRQAIPAYRVQDQYRFSRTEILEWATSRRLVVSAEIEAEPESAGQPIPSLVAAIEAGGIHYRVSGHDRPAVLREVVELLRLPEGVDRAFLLGVLMARESIASTAVGRGIAIPHARNPVLPLVDRPMIALCFLDEPIEFDALDGRAVHTLFTVVSPSTRAHLHLMAKLAHALADPEVRRAIESQATRAEILDRLRASEAKMAHPPTAPSPVQPTVAGLPRRSLLGGIWIGLTGLLHSMNELVLECEVPSWI